MKGLGGLNGWQWIFAIEGMITIVLGILTWLFVPDFPDKSRFLNEEERKACRIHPEPISPGINMYFNILDDSRSR